MGKGATPQAKTRGKQVSFGPIGATRLRRFLGMLLGDRNVS